MTVMIALAITPALCSVAAMALALKGQGYAGFLLVAGLTAFFIAAASARP